MSAAACPVSQVVPIVFGQKKVTTERSGTSRRSLRFSVASFFCQNGIFENSDPGGIPIA